MVKEDYSELIKVISNTTLRKSVLRDDSFYKLDHRQRIETLVRYLKNFINAPSIISSLVNRISEKEFVKYLELLLNHSEKQIGNIFFNNLLKELGFKQEFKITNTFRELSVHNKADLVVECAYRHVFIFEFKLDNYEESKDQTRNHAKIFESNFPAHTPYYFFIDSKSQKATCQKFKNYNLIPIKEALIRTIPAVTRKKDLLNLEIFIEVVNDLQRRAN